MPQYIKSSIENIKLPKIFGGQIIISAATRIGIYEQEINPNWMNFTLQEAIYKIYKDSEKILNEQDLMSIMARYLFNPRDDREILIKKLSGGQKARLQIIKMCTLDPNLLILDEPTNHLDLPSIEELEKFLLSYEGAIVYTSHDSYFIEKIKGEIIQI